MNHKPIRSTKRQRDKLAQCHAGVGILIYHEGNGTISESEFFTDRQGQLRPVTSALHAPPLRLEVIDEDEGIKVVEVLSRFAPNPPHKLSRNCPFCGILFSIQANDTNWRERFDRLTEITAEHADTCPRRPNPAPEGWPANFGVLATQPPTN